MPAQAAHNVARPLFGRTVSTFSNGLNYLAGFRGLRFMQQQCVTNAVNVLDDRPPLGLMNNDPIIRWVVSPIAQYVWWGAWVAAEEDGSAPRVQVYLETVAGVLIDGPIEWTPDNGRLPVSYYYNPALGSAFIGAAILSRDKFMNTGWVTETTSTAPRLLDVSAHQGQAVQIRVVANDVRIYSHMALEAWQSGL